MRLGWDDLLMPPALTLAFLLLGWPYARSVNGGNPLTPTQRGMLAYGSWYVLGMGYLIMLAGALHLANWMWVASIVGWIVALASVAWWRHSHTGFSASDVAAARSGETKKALPMVGLLICLVASGVEWELVAEGRGRWAVGLLWTTASCGMVALARSNRRATVVIALRTFLGLLLVGAIVQQNTIAFAAVGIGGACLFLVERFWRIKPRSEVHFNFRG